MGEHRFFITQKEKGCLFMTASIWYYFINTTTCVVEFFYRKHPWVLRPLACLLLVRF